jgi:hypothetical protein
MSKILNKYVLKNTAWLIVPPLFLNLFMGALPPAFSAGRFWANIPAFVAIPENTFRLLLCALPFFMPLTLVTKRQKLGLAVYLLGLAAYYLSWGVQIYFPLSVWSTHLAGFLAPAYTALIWFAGIGLISDRTFFKSPYRWWMYIVLSIIFICFHVTHTFIIFSRG